MRPSSDNSRVTPVAARSSALKPSAALSALESIGPPGKAPASTKTPDQDASNVGLRNTRSYVDATRVSTSPR
ncbi:hypothetical protein D3C73_1624520 [compost metagenome]